MSMKLPLNISDFEWKPREDPSNDIRPFLMWCSLNSIIDDSIRCRIFQHIIIGVVAMLYIDLKGGSYYTFVDLASHFLNRFQ